jgi:GTP cyclohydrolase II
MRATSYARRSAKLPTKFGEFEMYGYINDITGEHHVALVKGTSETGKMCSAACTPSA